MANLTGGEAVARQLRLEGVRHVFGVPGIQLDFAVEGLRQLAGDIRYVVPRHEQATSYMADGYARCGGTAAIGTMMVVPGPGLLNAMAGLATAYACNSRVLCITGQIHSSSMERGLGLLHELQAQDAILRSVTKWTARVRSSAEIPQTVREAIRQLRSGAPKPVAIEIPHDFLAERADIDLVQPPSAVDEVAAGRIPPNAEAAAAAAAMLGNAKLPVIYAGGGVLASDASNELRQLAESLQAPVVMSDNGRGALASSHPLALTTLAARAVLPACDVVLVVGSRFIDGMAPVPAWPSGVTRFIFINTQADHMISPRDAAVAVQGDAKLTLQSLCEALADHRAPRRSALATQANAWAEEQIQAIQPQAGWLNALAAASTPEQFVVHEMTQIGYFSRLALPVETPGGYLTPGYQGTLGFGFPTALGVAFARPHSRTISLNGDGGFGWNLQELSTAVKYALNVTVIVFVDGQFGNVRTIQSQLFGNNIGVDLCNPDYQLLCAAMGIRYARVDDPTALQAFLNATRDDRGPLFVEVRVGEMPSPWHLFKLQAPAIGGKTVAANPPVLEL